MGFEQYLEEIVVAGASFTKEELATMYQDARFAQLVEIVATLTTEAMISSEQRYSEAFEIFKDLLRKPNHADTKQKFAVDLSAVALWSGSDLPACIAARDQLFPVSSGARTIIPKFDTEYAPIFFFYRLEDLMRDYYCKLREDFMHEDAIPKSILLVGKNHSLFIKFFSSCFVRLQPDQREVYIFFMTQRSEPASFATNTFFDSVELPILRRCSKTPIIVYHAPKMMPKLIRRGVAICSVVEESEASSSCFTLSQQTKTALSTYMRDKQYKELFALQLIVNTTEAQEREIQSIRMLFYSDASSAIGKDPVLSSLAPDHYICRYDDELCSLLKYDELSKVKQALSFDNRAIPIREEEISYQLAILCHKKIITSVPERCIEYNIERLVLTATATLPTSAAYRGQLICINLDNPICRIPVVAMSKNRSCYLEETYSHKYCPTLIPRNFVLDLKQLRDIIAHWKERVARKRVETSAIAVGPALGSSAVGPALASVLRSAVGPRVIADSSAMVFSYSVPQYKHTVEKTAQMRSILQKLIFSTTEPVTAQHWVIPATTKDPAIFYICIQGFGPFTAKQQDIFEKVKLVYCRCGIAVMMSREKIYLEMREKQQVSITIQQLLEATVRAKNTIDECVITVRQTLLNPNVFPEATSLGVRSNAVRINESYDATCMHVCVVDVTAAPMVDIKKISDDLGYELKACLKKIGFLVKVQVNSADKKALILLQTTDKKKHKYLLCKLQDIKREYELLVGIDQLLKQDGKIVITEESGKYNITLYCRRQLELDAITDAVELCGDVQVTTQYGSVCFSIEKTTLTASRMLEILRPDSIWCPLQSAYSRCRNSVL